MATPGRGRSSCVSGLRPLPSRTSGEGGETRTLAWRAGPGGRRPSLPRLSGSKIAWQAKVVPSAALVRGPPPLGSLAATRGRQGTTAPRPDLTLRDGPGGWQPSLLLPSGGGMATAGRGRSPCGFGPLPSPFRTSSGDASAVRRGHRTNGSCLAHGLPPPETKSAATSPAGSSPVVRGETGLCSLSLPWTEAAAATAQRLRPRPSPATSSRGGGHLSPFPFRPTGARPRRRSLPSADPATLPGLVRHNVVRSRPSVRTRPRRRATLYRAMAAAARSRSPPDPQRNTPPHPYPP